MVALAITEGWVGSATVIVASPTPTALTTPSALTVATASSDDDHTTDVTVASTGSCETLSVTLSPTTSDTNAGDTDSFVMGTREEGSFVVPLFLAQSHTSRDSVDGSSPLSLIAVNGTSFRS